LLKEFTPYRIIFNYNTNNGTANFHHFSHAVSGNTYINAIKEIGGSRLIFHDEAWAGNGSTADYEKPLKLAKETGMKITINGCVSNSAQLLDMKKLSGSGIDSVIIGDALYMNSFPCQKIWRMIEAELEPGVKN
jgi:phosphoribosylformimino-5-aminoimidazole carboxamide ribotide isomerase